MNMDPANVNRVTIVGTGVIGSGWAAHYLRQGLDVTAYDPAPDAETRLRQKVARVWPAMEALGLKEGANPERLTFVPDLRTAVSNAQFIQESAPERLALKQDLLAEIDAFSPASAIIASSTSGYSMSDLQKKCSRHPERMVIAHPFNPPYLIPLVEVGGGEKSAPAIVDWAVDFYRIVGKKPLKMNKELPSFIANRLQEALWREALHMVNEDMATVEEIDAAIAWGPGLRWALMGPCLIFHLAGGEGGMKHMLEHFNPELFAD
jgi:carnitine 3-dehydrogenase